MYPNLFMYRGIPLYGVLLTGLLLLAPASAQSEALTRAEAIDLALNQNPEIKAARQAWEGARARARQAGAIPDPEFELEYEELPGIGDVGDFGERNMGVVQRIESPLKWWHRRKAGRQHAKATRLVAFETTRLAVTLRVNVAYDRIALQQNILKRTRESLDLAQDILRKARIRLEAGDVPQLEVMRAEVEAGRATNRVTVAKNELSAARAALNALLARPLRTPIAITDSLVFQPLTVDLDPLKALAVKQRPDLTGAQLRTIAFRTQQAAATAAYLPDLNVGVFRQRLRSETNEDDFWRLSFGLEIPLWALSRQRAEKAEVKAEAAQAQAEQEVLHNQVLLETEGAYLDVTTAQEQATLFKRRILPEAERAFEVASRSYDEGKATYLELLEAQRTLTETHIEYAQALFDFRAATAHLEWAIASPLPR